MLNNAGMGVIKSPFVNLPDGKMIELVWLYLLNFLNHIYIWQVSAKLWRYLSNINVMSVEITKKNVMIQYKT